MANQNQNNNSNYRPARSTRKPYIVHTAIGNVTFVRNPEVGNGGADILKSRSKAIVVGVTAEDMPFGLAQRVLGQYPEVYAELKKVQLVPGDFLAVQANDEKWIILSCIKRCKTDKPELKTISKILKGIGACLKDGRLPIESIAFTRIGCGPEQLEWTEVGMVFGMFLPTYNIPVAVYGIRDKDQVWVAGEDGKLVSYSKEDCISRDQQARMDAPKPQARAVVVSTTAPAKKERKARTSSAKKDAPAKKATAATTPKTTPVSTEAIEEPCGMFRDVPPEFAGGIPAADQALNVTID